MTDYSLSHLITDFIVHLRAAGLAKSTIASYHQDLQRLAGILGNIKAQSITDEDIGRAVVKIAVSEWDGSHLSLATLNRIKSAYRSFFKWAFESKRTRTNPAERLRRSRTHSCPTTPINASEINLLLETIRKSEDLHAERDEALFATYAFTGIRRSEALPLTIQDYDHRSAVLHLPQSKSGGRELKIVPTHLADILTKRIRSCIRVQSPLKRLLLFPGRSLDQPLSARNVQNRFDKWKKLSGIRKTLTIHSLRAGFATALYEATGDIFLVARAMGHRDIGTTMRYINPKASVLRRAVESTFVRLSLQWR